MADTQAEGAGQSEQKAEARGKTEENDLQAILWILTMNRRVDLTTTGEEAAEAEVEVEAQVSR